MFAGTQFPIFDPVFLSLSSCSISKGPSWSQDGCHGPRHHCHIQRQKNNFLLQLLFPEIPLEDIFLVLTGQDHRICLFLNKPLSKRRNHHDQLRPIRSPVWRHLAN